MSNEITTSMRVNYRQGYEMLAQQTESKLDPHIRTESETGERVNFQQVGRVAARKLEGRHADTRHSNTPHRRRWVTPDDYSLSDLLDQADAYKIISDPTGAYSQAFIAAHNRARDGNTLEGAVNVNYVGKHGLDQQNLWSSHVIPHASTGLTLAKVKTAVKLLKRSGAIQRTKEDQVFLAMTSQQEEEFLGTDEVINSRYTRQGRLDAGTMEGQGAFYGIDNWINLEDWVDDETNEMHRIVPLDGTTRKIVVGVKSGLVSNRPRLPTVMTDLLPGKNHSWQIASYSAFGATRMQEGKIVVIECHEPAPPQVPS